MSARAFHAWLVCTVVGLGLIIGPSVADGEEKRGEQTEQGEDDEDRAARVERLRNRVEAQRVAAAIQRFYKKTKRYRAKFDHTLFLAKQGKKQVRRGRLAFERPRKLSIRYEDPKGHRVVSDGKRVRVYDPDAKTLYVSKLKHSLYPALPSRKATMAG